MDIKAQLIEAGGRADIENAVREAEAEEDSIGGIIECRINNLPQGLGEPFFDSVESVLSHIIFAVPGIRGLEFGSGFKAPEMKGSRHNDSFVSVEGKTATNNHAGINGGITNGNEIVFRAAVKPTSSTSAVQKTMNFKEKRMTELRIEGRHDTCFALRVPVVIEAAAAVALADLLLINKTFNP